MTRIAHQMLIRIVFGSSVSLAIAGCAPMNASGGTGNGGSSNDGAGDWYMPSVDTTWQWQLQPDDSGRVNTSYDVDLYDLDLFDTDTATIDALHTAGRRVLCYFSAGSWEDFRADAGEFVADADYGNTLEGFADERWVDIRSSNVRRIMLERLDLAAEKGCDGVEPDNVTGFSNDTGFDLSAADQLDFNRFLADAAHARGMAVALKNDLEQIDALVEFFDLAVNEQCHEFDECDALQPFLDAGKPVLNAEYLNTFVDDAAARAGLCTDALARGMQTLVLPIDLDDAFRFSCEP